MKKLFTIIGLLIAFAAAGQNNYSGRGYQSLNADSTTIRQYLTNDSTAGRFTGWMYYNKQSKKWRIGWIDSDTLIQWQDLTGAGVAFLDSIKAYNGLTSVGADSVKLGGSGTENTVISMGAFSIDITTNGANKDISLTAVGLNSDVLIASTDGGIIAGADNVSIDATDDVTITGTDETILKNPTSNSVKIQTTGVAIDAGDAADDVTITGVDDFTATMTDAIGLVSGGATTITAGATSILTVGSAANTWTSPTATGLSLLTGNTQWSIAAGGSGTVQDDTHTILNGTRQTVFANSGITTSGAVAATYTVTNNETIAVNATANDVDIDALDDVLIDAADEVDITGAQDVRVIATADDLFLVANGGAGSAAFLRGPTGGVNISDSGGNTLIGTTGGTFTLASSTLDVSSTGVSNYTSAGNMNITATTGDDVNVTGADDVNIVAEGGDIIGSAAGNFHALATGDVFLSPGSGTGNDLRIVSGANRSMGTAVLVGGTVTVSNTKITASSNIFITSQVGGGTPGWLRISARVASTSFTITSSSGTDTSTVGWLIIEP